MMTTAIALAMLASAYDPGVVGASYDQHQQLGPTSLPGSGGGETVILDLLDGSGGGVATDGVVPGIPAPTYYWDARNPLTLVGHGAMAWTGTPGSEVTTPFGDMAAITFDKGATIGHLASSSAVSWAGTDYTNCYVARRHADDAGVANVVASNRTATSGVDAFEDQVTTGTGLCRHVHQTETAAAQTAATPAFGVSDGPWDICCTAVDVGTNQIAYSAHRGTTTTTAAPAGTFGAVSSTLGIGKAPRGASPFNFSGAIAAWWHFPGALSAANIRAIQNYILGLDTITDVQPDTVLADSATGCWDAGGEIIQVSDDMLPGNLGCAIPPGLTGAATACGGLFSIRAFTNSFLHNRLMSVGVWATTGASVMSTSAAVSPFRDDRLVTVLTDDDAGASEFVYQTVNIAALEAGDIVSMVVYARGVGAAYGLDWTFREVTGASCAGDPAVQGEAVAVSESWTTVFAQHTIADGDCEELVVSLAPISGAHPATRDTVTELGVVAVIPHLYLDVDALPPLVVNTTTAAVTAGGSDLEWNATIGALVQPAAGGTYRVAWSMTPYRVPWTKDATGYAWMLSNAGETSYITFGGLAGGTTEGQYDDSSSVQIADASWSQTAGTSYDLKVQFNYASQSHRYYRGGALIGADTSSDTTPPAGLTGVYLGGPTAATGQYDGACISDLRMVRQ